MKLESYWTDTAPSFVTSTYAELQGRAAEKCGVLLGLPQAMRVTPGMNW